MTVPLIVLAFFSVAAGWLNWPLALGGQERFHHYLAPVFAPAEAAIVSTAATSHGGQEASGLGLIATSVTVALAGIFVAFWFYLKSPDLPAHLAARFSGAYRVLVNKYYVDELYHWLFVWPVRVGSEKVLWGAVDTRAIDGLMVDGSSDVALGAGSLLRRIQSGNLRSYAAWILLGAVVWLGYALTR